MTLETKSVFCCIRQILEFSDNNSTKEANVLHNDLFFEEFLQLIALSQSHNGWYTPEQVYFSVQSWAKALTEEQLTEWLSNYDFSTNDTKTVALILAGNIPLVGFHDFYLC
jgi:hypothetical protein